MADTNYIGGVVKILETPRQKIFDNNILVAKFRVQFPQLQNTRVINLTFCGNLARDVINYYKVNDYILIEGYLSLHNQRIRNLAFPKFKKVNITVLRVYPFLLSYNPSSL